MRQRTVITHDVSTGEITTVLVVIEDYTPPYTELRLDAYRIAFTLDELMEALFEQQEGRPEKMNALQSRRAAIKAQYPKSEGKE